PAPGGAWLKGGWLGRVQRSAGPGFGWWRRRRNGGRNVRRVHNRHRAHRSSFQRRGFLHRRQREGVAVRRHEDTAALRELSPQRAGAAFLGDAKRRNQRKRSDQQANGCDDGDQNRADAGQHWKAPDTSPPPLPSASLLAMIQSLSII